MKDELSDLYNIPQEERPIFCTYCGDVGVVSVAKNPCPKCRLEEYKQWREDYESEKRCRANLE